MPLIVHLGNIQILKLIYIRKHNVLIAVQVSIATLPIVDQLQE